METLFAPNVLVALMGTAGVVAMYLSLIYVQRARLAEIDHLEGRIIQRGLMERLQDKLDQADIPVTAQELIKVSLLLGVGISGALFLILRLFVPSLMGFFIGAFGYWAFLEDRRNKRRQQYQTALGEAVDIIRENFSHSQSLDMALEQVVKYGPEILREDFQLLSTRLAARQRLREAFEEICRRRKDPILDVIAETLLIHERKGGRLGDVLERLSRAVKERVRIRERVRQEQALPIWEGRIVSVSPFFFMVFMKLFIPDYVGPFYATSIGQLSLLGAGILSMAGYLVMNHMATRATRVLESVGLRHGEAAPEEERLPQGLKAVRS